MNKWGRRSSLLFGVVVWPLMLVFVGGFPIRQGILLGLLMAWLALGIGKSAVKPDRIFTPYYVWVLPKWYQLLPDFKLVSSLDEWCSIASSAKSANRVLREGLWFTVIRGSEGSDECGPLIYLNQPREFVTKFHFSEDMVPIRIEREDGLSDALSRYQPVQFFMDGYSLGIIVPDWWWRKVKGSCPTPIEEHQKPLTGEVKLLLATIPNSEFDIYWQATAAEWDEWFFKILPKIRKQRGEHRQKLGWTAEKRDHLKAPEHIEHKYFEVRHRDI